jgi:hypothetical protein
MNGTRINYKRQHMTSAAALACVLSACAGETPDASARTPDRGVTSLEQNIISNAKTSDATIDRLGLVQLASSDSYCSAVLIGPHSALTARHCNSDVGTTISFRGETYTATQTFEPPSPQYDTPWGPRDLEILVLDRDVVVPGTNTPWNPELPVWPFDLPSQVDGKLLCFGAGPNQVVNGSPAGNGARDFYGAVRPIAAIEDGSTYRVVPGLEHGDSGGPCFAPIWWNNQYEYALMSINGTSARGSNRDGSDQPGSDAALIATGEAGITDWINGNIH